MAIKSVQPIGNKFIVLPSEKKEEVSGSIIVPETANANLSEGVVVEATVEFEHLVKKGDRVVFSTGSGVGYFYQGKPHIILQINEIWGIVQN
jgi:co-chaperonin GroES (HSP10)